MLRGNATARWPAGLDGLDRVTVRSAAAHFLDDLPERNSHRHFDEAVVGDLAGEREHFRALAFLRAETRIPVRSFADDGRDVGKRLDVVDERGATPQAALRREGRTRTRRAALAFDGSHERGFLSANKSARADADVHVENEGRFKNASAEQAKCLGLLDRDLQTGNRQRIFRADIKKTLIRADRVS